MHDRLFERYELLLALAPVKYMLGGLVVHPDNMVRNVRLTDGAFEYGGRHDGSRPQMCREKAHDKISAICIAVSQGKGRLIDLLTEESEIRKIFDRQALARLLDPTSYVGKSSAMVDRVLSGTKG